MDRFEERTITEAVLRSVAQSRSARTKRISEALIRHLHAFITEIEPSEQEWETGIAFLTETGRMCSDVRQEFILLSDVLGVSMLVDAINHRLPNAATATTVLGPFYVPPQEFCCGSDIRGRLDGTPLYISATVRSDDGEPLADAIVDIWHSDPDGYYDVQLLDKHPDFSGRGRFRTDKQGAFDLWTIRPRSYPIPNDGPVGRMLEAQGRHPHRPEHVHFLIQAPAHEKLTTHLFAAGDEYLTSDVVFGVKDSLIRELENHSGGVAPDGREMEGSWCSLHNDFVLARCVDEPQR